tara:strand:+ start:9094 stop:9600 length:507 start_codon:yes stop_codon:yes gene_type:complete
MTTLQQNAAGLELGSVIEFLQIDLTQFGEGIIRVYNSIDLTSPTSVTFLGVEWTPVPFESEGWGFTGSGGTPRPRITVADYDGILLGLAMEYQDLIGATITRYETTYENLVDGTYYGPEIWQIFQKVESDGNTMKIELASPLDIKSKKIPAWEAYRSEFPALGRNRAY